MPIKLECLFYRSSIGNAFYSLLPVPGFSQPIPVYFITFSLCSLVVSSRCENTMTCSVLLLHVAISNIFRWVSVGKHVNGLCSKENIQFISHLSQTRLTITSHQLQIKQSKYTIKYLSCGIVRQPHGGSVSGHRLGL